MKTWHRYEQHILSGEWHIHTTYTDGGNSVAEYCEVASDYGIPLLAFTEHVSIELTYDFNEFLEEIDSARSQYDLIILSGCEAKVLPDGSLNVSDSVIGEVEYPIFSFHSFPGDLALFLESLERVFQDRRVNTWAHPGRLPVRQNMEIDSDALQEIMKQMKHNNILLEVNRRYGLPKKEWVEEAKRIGLKLVRGSDVHSIEELELSTTSTKP
jgi:DNA polymerase (family 10)/putative hydrolase